MVGSATAIATAREHPLARALRIDKLSLAALEATLLLYRDPERARVEIPALAMLEAGEEVLLRRARRLRDEIGNGQAELARAVARVGGGALPLLELEGPVVEVVSQRSPDAITRALRESDPPVLGRIHDGRVVLDPRTLVSDDEVEIVAGAVRAALS
jgi:L-seryl-tRNA(Ser) seleniumtransferase